MRVSCSSSCIALADVEQFDAAAGAGSMLRQMAGIQDTGVVDLVTHNSTSDEYTLIMIETRPWTDSTEQLAQLLEKINNYAVFALDGEMARAYPDSVGKQLRIQLDCQQEPSTRAAEVVDQARRQLADHNIPFEVNILS